MSNKKKNIKRQNITQLALGLIIIISINIIASFFFTRFDLTSEKRYTLSKATKTLVKELDDIVYFKVYLDGDFPAGFKKLRNETKEMLDEFRAYNKNIQYEFINPSESEDKSIRTGLYQQLMGKGLQPTTVQSDKNDVQSQQVIFPGALVSYKSKELPLQLLISQMGVPPEAQINSSVQAMEFNIANVIKKLTIKQKPKIAFIQGHGELSGIHIASIKASLSEYYNVEDVRLNEQIQSLTTHRELDSGGTVIINKYKAIIIAKPDSIFSEKDKFIIDQFIIRGGSSLWLIDPVFASMDSLQFKGETYGFAKRLNLEDQLFKYGVRLNTDLILDMSCVGIPLNTQPYGSQPKFKFFPWYYSPVIFPLLSHPVVANLNAIKTEFISSIDTVGTKGIKKTVLLSSSEYSKTINTPARISLEIIREKNIEQSFRNPYNPVAVLLEGKFESVFKNRIAPEAKEEESIGFLEIDKPSKMIVISDGDIIKNQIHWDEGKARPYPLGIDKYSGTEYGNNDFILNAVNYLCDESGLISVRSRELKIRLLDKTKITTDRLFWQLLNTLIPILIITILGIVLLIIRKRKYQRD
ncbi:MAG: gliding motility-associated ABC transporter substrate-binding protein GldG [Saprospiraceae bacterium]|nr:gliding motility-associated ABC transporter substrate-binding protein GldG [Saprospiraceae bacterium]